MSGRKPLPSNVKEFKGTQRKSRTNTNEPEYAAASTLPPEFLDDMAREQWVEICPKLVASGVMRDIDKSALAMFCQSYSRWRAASAEVGAQGMLIASPSGYPIQNPYLPIANKAFEQMLKIMAEFGMTPSARSRVIAAKPNEEKESKTAKYFNK